MGLIESQMELKNCWEGPACIRSSKGNQIGLAGVSAFDPQNLKEKEINAE